MRSLRSYLHLLLLAVFVLALSGLGLAQGPEGRGPGPVWGHGPVPRRGACFYREANFGGDYFCMRPGESFPSLPPGFNDRISSIQVFRARVQIYNDPDFRGVNATARRGVNNLREWRLPNDSSRSWNDRISSIQVF